MHSARDRCYSDIQTSAHVTARFPTTARKMSLFQGEEARVHQRFPKKSPFLLHSSEIPFANWGTAAESDARSSSPLETAPFSPPAQTHLSPKDIFSKTLDRSFENRPSRPKRAFKDFGLHGSSDRSRHAPKHNRKFTLSFDLTGEERQDSSTVTDAWYFGSGSSSK